MNDKTEIPKKITKTVYLGARPGTHLPCGYSFEMFDFKAEGYIILGSTRVTMDVPQGYDLTNAHIDILKSEKERINAEAHLKAKNIDEQIQRLLAIEHKDGEL